TILINWKSPADNEVSSYLYCTVTFLSYAPWCPVCQQMELAWEAFARNSKELELSVGKVDVTQEPGVSGRFLVTTLPTIYHAKDGVFRRYRGSKTLEDLKSYILERKWESIEPVAGWKYIPNNLIDNGTAVSIQIMFLLQQIHNYFTGTLGIHIWVSYAIFILATLLIGLILALVRKYTVNGISPEEFIIDQEDIGIPTILGNCGKINGRSKLSMLSEKIIIKNLYCFWCS
uniref:Thioredoxin domain-containing protein n=1 Tax=Laticauda laticaudata TaxID=8630 RepID=A0A8C5RBR4_LATLA